MKVDLLYPVIVTDKIKKSLTFYQTHFGFDIIADVGWYKHLRHSGGNAELALMEPDHPSQPPLFQTGFSGKGIILSFQVGDINSTYQTIKAAGVSIEYELTREEWGQVHFGISDPNGIAIDIVQEANEF